MTPTGYNPVREDTAQVMENAEHVSINEKAVEEYAEELAGMEEDEVEVPPWMWDGYPSADWSDEKRLQETVLGCIVNFCYADPHDPDRQYATRTELPDDEEPQTYERSDGNWAAFKRGTLSDDHPDFLDAETLASIEYDEENPEESEVHAFYDPVDGSEIPMLEERHEILKDAGETLLEKYDGSVMNIWEASDGYLFHPNSDESGFVERLVRDFKGFQDSWEHPVTGETRFYKKAQLAANLAYGHFQFDDFFDPEDVEELTVFSDYRLPQTLSHPEIGILEYDEELREKIDSQEIIPAGSREEIELRAATVQAAEQVMEETNSRREEEISVPELDFLLFTTGRRLEETEHHLTPTTAY